MIEDQFPRISRLFVNTESRENSSGDESLPLGSVLRIVRAGECQITNLQRETSGPPRLPSQYHQIKIHYLISLSQQIGYGITAIA